jgi:uncharacterized protein (TIGR02246 family)
MGCGFDPKKEKAMKRLIMVISLLVLFSSAFGCRQIEDKSGESGDRVKTDIQAIRKITEEWESAINAGDTDTLMSFYSDYAVQFPPNEPAVVGKEAIRASYQKHFEEQIRQEKHAVADIKVSGDLAITSTGWSLSAAPEAGGSSQSKGYWLRIFGKQPDGSWKIIYMMWSDESLISPDQAE